jgi:hypothetical protein
MSRKTKPEGKRRDQLAGEDDFLSPHWLREEVAELRFASREQRKRLKPRDRHRDPDAHRLEA